MSKENAKKQRSIAKQHKQNNKILKKVTAKKRLAYKSTNVKFADQDWSVRHFSDAFATNAANSEQAQMEIK